MLRDRGGPATPPPSDWQAPPEALRQVGVQIPSAHHRLSRRILGLESESQDRPHRSSERMPPLVGLLEFTLATPGRTFRYKVCFAFFLLSSADCSQVPSHRGGIRGRSNHNSSCRGK